MFDLVIRDGTLIDGSGQPRRRADVGLRGDRIAAIGLLKDAPARQMISAQGRIVAPGFIDVHNHSDGWLLKTPHLVPKTMQGFTTEVLMSDGISYAPVSPQTAPHWVYYLRALNGLRLDEYRGWQSLGDFLAALDRRTAQNVAVQTPYANVRTLACGWSRAAVDDFQMTQIKALVRQAMDHGAVGLSTGLDYIVQCFSTTDELVGACQAMADRQGLYVTHVRYKTGLISGVQEAVQIGRRAGVPVHISHLKGITPADRDAVLHWLDRQESEGVDLSFDVYPYVPGSTMLSYLLPYEVWEQGPLAAQARLIEPEILRRFGQNLQTLDLERVYLAWLPGQENQHHLGRTVAQYVASTGREPAEALAHLLLEERMAVLMVVRFAQEDSLVEPLLQHPRFMLGTDGIYWPEGAVHPRMFGSTGRILGDLVRKRKLFSLEEAVRKLSGFPAQRFGLNQRGLVTEGYFADLVIFDAENIHDPATYDQPRQLTRGVDYVFVNGTLVIAQGQPCTNSSGELPGRALKYRA